MTAKRRRRRTPGLDRREDHIERQRVTAKVINAKDHVTDLIKQRLALIHGDKGYSINDGASHNLGAACK